MKDINSLTNNTAFMNMIRDLQDSLEATYDKLVEELSPDLEMILEARKRILEKPEYYMDLACERIEENHGECYFAKDEEEALELIEMVFSDVKKVVVSSIDEIRDVAVVKSLREKGIDVYYSYMYHFLADLAGVKYPSLYNFKSLSEKEILKGVNSLLGVNYSELKKAEKDVVEFLKTFFSEADAGITSAHALAADTGSLFIIDYVGDIRLVTGAPKTHLAIVGVDKIYPTYIEAWTATYVRYRFCSICNPSGISIISGPSMTGDIEKVTTYGAHGPEKLIVILLDNGRRKLFFERDLNVLSNCISCNLCPVSLPVTRAVMDNLIRPFEGLKDLILSSNDLDEEKKRFLTYIVSYFVKEYGNQFKCPFKIDVEDVLKRNNIWVEDIPEDVKKSLDSFVSLLKKNKTHVV